MPINIKNQSGYLLIQLLVGSAVVAIALTAISKMSILMRGETTKLTRKIDSERAPKELYTNMMMVGRLAKTCTWISPILDCAVDFDNSGLGAASLAHVRFVANAALQTVTYEKESGVGGAGPFTPWATYQGIGNFVVCDETSMNIIFPAPGGCPIQPYDMSLRFKDFFTQKVDLTDPLSVQRGITNRYFRFQFDGPVGLPDTIAKPRHIFGSFSLRNMTDNNMPYNYYAPLYQAWGQSDDPAGGL